MSEDLKPCPLCGSTDIACFAEYDGDSYDNEPIYRAVVACLGCHEEGCDPSYDEEPCFGIEAYFRADHPLIKDCEDPSDCERVLERHMAERWNRRAERTCRMEYAGEVPPSVKYSCYFCSECGSPIYNDMEPSYCLYCGAKVVSE